jgi:hypothetical protein
VPRAARLNFINRFAIAVPVIEMRNYVIFIWAPGVMTYGISRSNSKTGYLYSRSAVGLDFSVELSPAWRTPDSSLRM